MVNLKNLIISKKKRIYPAEEFDEKDLSAQQFKAKKNAWLFGEDEYQKRPKRLKTEENEGKEEADRLTLTFLMVSQWSE